MSKKGIIWGVISYGILWLAFTAFINVYGIPIKAVGPLLILCSILAGVVAAKNSRVNPFLSAAISGGIVGTVVSLTGLAFEGELTVSLIYTTMGTVLFFVAGAVVLWIVSFFIRQLTSRA